jgi:hypothetical protein
MLLSVWDREQVFRVKELDSETLTLKRDLIFIIT